MQSNAVLPRCLAPCVFAKTLEPTAENGTVFENPTHTQNGAQRPFQVGALLTLVFKSRKRIIATDDDTRPAYEVRFRWRNPAQSRAFRPGDAIGIVCPNVRQEVDTALRLLHLTGEEWIKVSAVENEAAKKRFQRQFTYVPDVCSARHLFSHVVDLRTVVKRVFLRILGDCCPANSEDRESLYRLSASPDEYKASVLEGRMTVLDVLETFPQCKPSVSVLVENLSRLAARFYSVANYDSREIRIIYRPMKFEANGRTLLGLCSSFFDAMDQVDLSFSKLSLAGDEQLGPVAESDFEFDCYLRKNVRNFEFPPEATPFIYICHGTGVAPIEAQLDWLEKTNSIISSCERWILYGCRYVDKDLLLDVEKATKLNFRVILKQSRAKPNQGYVQSAVQDHSEDILRLIDTHGGEILICGDLNTMTAETLNELKKVLVDTDGNERVSLLLKENKIKLDVWT